MTAKGELTLPGPICARSIRGLLRRCVRYSLFGSSSLVFHLACTGAQGMKVNIEY